MTINEITNTINREWNSNQMQQFTGIIERALDQRLSGYDIEFKDILNNTNHILTLILQKTNNKTNNLYYILAAAGLRVISLYGITDGSSIVTAKTGSSVETIPWGGIPIDKEQLISVFLKSMEEDFHISLIN